MTKENNVCEVLRVVAFVTWNAVRAYEMLATVRYFTVRYFGEPGGLGKRDKKARLLAYSAVSQPENILLSLLTYIGLLK